MALHSRAFWILSAIRKIAKIRQPHVGYMIRHAIYAYAYTMSLDLTTLLFADHGSGVWWVDTFNSLQALDKSSTHSICMQAVIEESRLTSSSLGNLLCFDDAPFNLSNLSDNSTLPGYTILRRLRCRTQSLRPWTLIWQVTTTWSGPFETPWYRIRPVTVAPSVCALSQDVKGFTDNSSLLGSRCSR